MMEAVFLFKPNTPLQNIIVSLELFLNGVKAFSKDANECIMVNGEKRMKVVE